VEAELPERGVELELAAGHSFDLLAEALECLLQLVPELTFRLFSRKIIPVVHVLMLAQVCSDFADFSVELKERFKSDKLLFIFKSITCAHLGSLTGYGGQK